MVNKRNLKAVDKDIFNNKGFTMVELIVVLVILTIVAAVAVPAMLGFTDGAKEKRYISKGKAAYAAAQTALNDLYNDTSNRLDSDKRYSVADISGVDASSTRFKVWTGSPLIDGVTESTSKSLNSYTIIAALFETTNDDTGKYVVFDGTDWKVVDEKKDAESLLKVIGCTYSSSNVINMWPNYSDNVELADNAFDLDPDDIVEDWGDGTDEGGSKTYTLTIHNTNLSQAKNEPGIIFKKGENISNTEATLTLEFTEDETGTVVSKNWKDEDTISIGSDEYTITYVYGFDNLKWSTEGYPDQVDVENIYTWDSIVYNIKKLNKNGIYDLYPFTDKLKEERQVAFKCVDGSDSLTFGDDGSDTKTVTFSRYINPYDSDIYSRNVSLNKHGQDSSDGTVYISDLLKNYSLSDYCRLNGWAFWQNDGYELKDDSTEIKSYTEEATFWKKAFSVDDVENCAFVGITEKYKNVKLYTEGKGYSDFNGKSSLSFEASAYNELTGVTTEKFDVYEATPLSIHLGYRLDGWERYRTIPTGNFKNINEIWDEVRENPPGEYSYIAKVGVGSKAKFIAKGTLDKNDAASLVGQIYALFGWKRDATYNVSFKKSDYSAAVSFLKEAGVLNDIMTGYETEDIADDKAVPCSGHYKLLQLNKAVNGGNIKCVAVLWDGNDTTYNVPIFAYNVVNGNNYQVYWFSQEDHPELVGGFDSLFEGYKNVNFTGSCIDDWNTSTCTSMQYMFKNSGLADEHQIDLTKWQYNSVISVEQMFFGCTKLHTLSYEGCSMPVCTSFKSLANGATSLETVNFNMLYSPSLTVTSDMFTNANSITVFTARGWDAGSSKDITTRFSLATMLKDKKSLTMLDFSDYDEEHTTDLSRCSAMNGLVQNCTSLTAISFENMNISSCTTFADMCNGCSKLISANFNRCNSSALTNVSSMFANAPKLVTFTAKGWKAGKVSSLASFMSGKSALTTFDIGHYDEENETDLSSCTSMSNMLLNCSSLQNVSLESISLEKCTTFNSMCKGCSSLASVNMDGCLTPALTDVAGMFSGANKLTSFTAIGWDARKLGSLKEFMKDKAMLTTFRLSDDTDNEQDTNLDNCSSMEKMLYGCKLLPSISLKGLKLNKLTNVSGMLSDCSGLTSVVFDDCEMKAFTGTFNPFNNNTKNVATFSAKNWDIYKATSFSQLFYRGYYTGPLPDGTEGNVGYSKIETIDFTGANLSSINSMYEMCFNCPELDSITFKDADFGEDTETINCREMFFHSFNLRYINFDVKNPLRPNNMYKFVDFCLALKTIDFGLEQAEMQSRLKEKFDTSKTTVMGNAFYQCGVLDPDNKFYEFLDYSSAKMTSRMFYGLYSYLPDKTDITFKNLDMSSIDATAAPNNAKGMEQMFQWANANIVTFENCDISKVTSVTNMFSSVSVANKQITTINEVRFIDCKFDKLTNMTNMFKEAEIGEVSFVNCNFDSVTATNSMFKEAEIGKVSFVNCNFDSLTATNANDVKDMFLNAEIEKVSFVNCDLGALTSFQTMLKNTKLKEVSFENSKLNKITQLRDMFAGSSSIEIVRFDGTEMNGITGLDGKFEALTNLKAFYARGWQVGNVTNMSKMFSNKKYLETVDFSEYENDGDIKKTDIGKCTTMMEMFSGCTALKSVKFCKGTDMRKITTFNKMLNGCGSFTTDAFEEMIGAWDLSNSAIAFNKTNNTGAANSMINSGCTHFSEESSFYSYDGQEYIIGGPLNNNYSLSLYKKVS